MEVERVQPGEAHVHVKHTLRHLHGLYRVYKNSDIIMEVIRSSF